MPVWHHSMLVVPALNDGDASLRSQAEGQRQRWQCARYSGIDEVAILAVHCGGRFNDSIPAGR